MTGCSNPQCRCSSADPSCERVRWGGGGFFRLKANGPCHLQTPTWLRWESETIMMQEQTYLLAASPDTLRTVKGDRDGCSGGGGGSPLVFVHLPRWESSTHIRFHCACLVILKTGVGRLIVQMLQPWGDKEPKNIDFKHWNNTNKKRIPQNVHTSCLLPHKAQTQRLWGPVLSQYVCISLHADVCHCSKSLQLL